MNAKGTETAPKIDKAALYAEVVKRVAAHAPPDAARTALCFYYAAFGVEALREAGLRAVIQAGSASWPIIDLDKDDGVQMTHFSYQWSPNEIQSRLAIAGGAMPEMHVWVALPDSGELVDFTTGFWPEQAKLLTGLDWPGPKPPNYLWDKKLPRGVQYTPIRDAVTFALWAAAKTFGMERAKKLVTS